MADVIAGAAGDERHETSSALESAAGLDAAGLNVAVCWPQRDVTVVSVHGEIDAASAPRLWEALKHRLASCSRVVILDLSGVVFLDCAGVEVLSQSRSEAASRQVSLKLIVTRSGPVEKLLDLLGVSLHFSCYRTLDEALDNSAPRAGE